MAQPIAYYDLQQPIFYFTKEDPWRIGDACEGTQIFGATGSGKTSGSGKSLALAFLRAGFGGLVLTVKPDEADNWRNYVGQVNQERAGRGEDPIPLLIFSPSNQWRFNFMEYEFGRPGRGAGLTENLVNLFFTVIEASERKNGGEKGDQYWTRSAKQLLRNAIDLLAIAKGKLSLLDIYTIISTAPQSFEQRDSEAWQNGSFCYQCIEEGEAKEKSFSKERDFKFTAKYWLGEFPSLASETRTSIVSVFTSMADCFLRGVLADLFCGETTILPEYSQSGAVIVLDLPVKEYGDLGQFAQVLFKFIWQKATERRNTQENPRPVFLWVDEAHNFFTSYDMQFQSTARSSRACTVYLTQSLPNYYAVMGGTDKGRPEADSLLGNLQTKIFHANGDSTTNQWAAELIGKIWQKRIGTNQGETTDHTRFGQVTSSQDGFSTNEVYEYEVLPRDFTTLKKGGLENNRIVEGFVFQGGRIWNATGKNHIKIKVTQ